MVSNLIDSENGKMTDIAYAMPAFAGLPGLEEAARDFLRSGAFNEESAAMRPALSLVSAQSTVPAAIALIDDKALSDAKHEALAKVPVGPVGSYSAVQEIVNKIRSSNDPREVMNLATQLEAVINSTERLKGEEQDPQMTAEQRYAQHRELYNTDAVYRAETDRISAEAKETLEESDKKQAEQDKFAEDHGIVTDEDDKVKKLREKVEAANAKGGEGALEAREAEAEYYAALAKQNKAREEEAVKQNKPEVAAQFKSKQATYDAQAEQADMRAEEQTEAFKSAFDRKVKKGKETTHDNDVDTDAYMASTQEGKSPRLVNRFAAVQPAASNDAAPSRIALADDPEATYASLGDLKVPSTKIEPQSGPAGQVLA